MQPFETFGSQFDHLWRVCMAYILITALLVFSVVAIPYPVLGALKAPVFLMVIYYWSIYRPTLIPPWFAFLCGIFVDALSGLPLGLNAFTYVLVHWFVAEQRKFLLSQSFALVWLGYTIVSLSVTAFQWLLFNFVMTQMTPFSSFAVSFTFGVALFPLICVMLHITHKILPEPPSGYGYKVQV